MQLLGVVNIHLVEKQDEKQDEGSNDERVQNDEENSSTGNRVF